MNGETSSRFEHIQDVLGQLSSLKIYTHLALGFALEQDPDAISQELHRAAEQLVLAFPFLAGHVVRRGSGPGKTGLATIVPYPSGERPSLVIVKNCQSICPSMETTLAAGAPMDMLDGEVLARRKGGPQQYDESMEPACVLEIQANFIQGGLILVFQGNHNIMDMNGMGQIIEMYAKALRMDTFTTLEILQGNQDRRNIVKLLDPSQLCDMGRFTSVAKAVKSSPLQAETFSPNVHWVYFHFSAESLALLKKSASSPLGGNHNLRSVPWISRDDALSAWLCQRILIARLKRLPKAPKAKICRAVNARRFLVPPIPKEYTGHAVTCAYTELGLDDPAATGDLSSLAHQMRSDVLATKSHEIQSFATKLNSLDDKAELSFGAQLNLAGFDLVLSSWSALGAGVVEFGKALGQPVFAKRPRFSCAESIIYLMPKTMEGHVDVACCLRVEDIESLRSDAEFTKYGRFVG